MAAASLPALPAATSAPTPPAPEDLPLSHRIWRLYCHGGSFSSIARDLGLERHSVARHVRAIQRTLAAEHTEDLLLARDRAVHAAYELLAATWDHLDAESRREDLAWRDLEPAPSAHAESSPRTSASPAPTAPRYRAQHARLLGIALRALSQAARLQGLDSPAGHPTSPPRKPAPALDAPAPHTPASPPLASAVASAAPATHHGKSGTKWNIPPSARASQPRRHHQRPPLRQPILLPKRAARPLSSGPTPAHPADMT